MWGIWLLINNFNQLTIDKIFQLTEVVDWMTNWPHLSYMCNTHTKKICIWNTMTVSLMSIHISSYFIHTDCVKISTTLNTQWSCLYHLPFVLHPFKLRLRASPSIFALWPLSTPALPSILPPPPHRQRVCRPKGSVRAVIVRWCLKNTFLAPTLLKDKIGGLGKISWLSSKNNPRHKCLFFVCCIFPSTSWFIHSVWPSCEEKWGGSMAELGIAKKSGNARLGTRRTLICSSQIWLSATWTHQACHVIIWYTLWALMFCQLLLSELSDKFTEDADVVVQRSFYFH